MNYYTDVTYQESPPLYLRFSSSIDDILEKRRKKLAKFCQAYGVTIIWSSRDNSSLNPSLELETETVITNDISDEDLLVELLEFEPVVETAPKDSFVIEVEVTELIDGEPEVLGTEEI